jgi:hypothetical protein
VYDCFPNSVWETMEQNDYELPLDSINGSSSGTFFTNMIHTPPPTDGLGGLQPPCTMAIVDHIVIGTLFVSPPVTKGIPNLTSDCYGSIA